MIMFNYVKYFAIFDQILDYGFEFGLLNNFIISDLFYLFYCIMIKN